ncbi:hypothetical protein IQ266_19240 [filamentous cyanobacterium LEGE 11480]|uniref:PEP-CTERM sorting domain-containing protein n=1 Tax=Romeriopsis navalis LEGE 11480 TaxID=2777977 RepID=A0A928VNJ8_9CYAN|nr:hypothetical protein [Romeriopsis navalis]MBE9031873.1 hypothetical protein [Romeriopsis navalis LEGE 11480]
MSRSIYLKRRSVSRVRPTGILSIVVGLTLTPLPCFAATLAASTAELQLFNFTHSPQTVETITPIFTEAISSDNGAIADANAQALAEIGNNPSETIFINSTLTEAAGEGLNYSATAEATAIGTGYDFFIPKNSTFGFNFDGLLGAIATTDGRSTEQATADSTIVIQIFSGSQPDDLSLIESLAFFGQSDRVNRRTALSVDYSDGFQVNHSNLPLVEFTGNFQRRFHQNTYITLVEAKDSTAQVGRNAANSTQVPTPSVIPALSIVALKLCRKRADTSSTK